MSTTTEADRSAEETPTLHLARWTVTSGSNANSRGAVVIASGDHQWEASAEGNGAVDALFRAVDRALAEQHDAGGQGQPGHESRRQGEREAGLSSQAHRPPSIPAPAPDVPASGGSHRQPNACLLYTSPIPRDQKGPRRPSFD